MASFQLSFRQQRVQLTLLLLGLFAFYLYHCSSDSAPAFTNEEVNELLSGISAASDIDRIPLKYQYIRVPFLLHLELNWDLHGDTLIKNQDFIRLTTENPDQHGLISNTEPFDSSGFEMEVKFHIHGEASNHQLKGDGAALFLTSTPQNELGPVFGAQDQFEGLGVFFDTYRNDVRGPVFPYINAMIGDGQISYDKDHDGKAHELAGCSARNLYNPKQGYSLVRLLHTAEDGYLSLDYNVNGEWVNCFSVAGVHLPKKRYVSMSAATGQLVETVDLMSIEINELQREGDVVVSWADFTEHIDEDLNEEKDAVPRKGYKNRNAKQRAKLRAKLRNRNLRNEAFNAKKKEADQSPGWLRAIWSLIKIGFWALLLLVVLYVAFTVYRVKSRRNKRRSTGLLD